MKQPGRNNHGKIGKTRQLHRIHRLCAGGCRFSREKLYVAMIRFVAPVLLVFLLLQALGIVKL